MRSTPTALALIAALLGLPSLALAQTTLTVANAQPPATTPAPVRWDHGGQFGLRFGLSQGYRFVVRYQDGAQPDPCDEGNNKFCVGASPLMLDTALGFGVTRTLELEARMRLGVLTNFDDSRPLQLGMGLRVLSDPESRLKFVLGVAMYADLTSGRLRAGGDLDFILRAEEGLQYDANRWFGFYASAGESFGLLRNFSCIVDFNLGVQFRAPP